MENIKFGTILENPNSGNHFSTDLPTRLACITLFIQQSLQCIKTIPQLSLDEINLNVTHYDELCLKSQVVSLQTAHSWANAGVLLGDACIGSGVAFEAI